MQRFRSSFPLFCLPSFLHFMPIAIHLQADKHPAILAIYFQQGPRLTA